MKLWLKVWYSSLCNCLDYKNMTNIHIATILLLSYYRIKKWKFFIQRINLRTKPWPHFWNCSQKTLPTFTRAKQVQCTSKYIDVLKRHSNFGKPQIFECQRKGGPKVANCKGHCKRDIIVGHLCLKVHNTLSMSYSKWFSTVNSSYVCARITCIIKTPLWDHLVVLTVFLSSLNVTDEVKGKIFKEVDITI